MYDDWGESGFNLLKILNWKKEWPQFSRLTSETRKNLPVRDKLVNIQDSARHHYIYRRFPSVQEIHRSSKSRFSQIFPCHDIVLLSLVKIHYSLSRSWLRKINIAILWNISLMDKQNNEYLNWVCRKEQCCVTKYCVTASRPIIRIILNTIFTMNFSMPRMQTGCKHKGRKPRTSGVIWFEKLYLSTIWSFVFSANLILLFCHEILVWAPVL